MSCPRLAASTESAAICLHASRCRRVARVRRRRTQRCRSALFLSTHNWPLAIRSALAISLDRISTARRPEYGGDQAAAHGLTALKQIVSIDLQNDLPPIRKLAARQVDRKHPGGGACEKFCE